MYTGTFTGGASFVTLIEPLCGLLVLFPFLSDHYGRGFDFRLAIGRAQVSDQMAGDMQGGRHISREDCGRGAIMIRDITDTFFHHDTK
jgi:hypothetical protein